MKKSVYDITCADIAYSPIFEVKKYKEMLFAFAQKMDPWHNPKYCNCLKYYSIFMTLMSDAVLRIKCEED